LVDFFIFYFFLFIFCMFWMRGENEET